MKTIIGLLLICTTITGCGIAQERAEEKAKFEQFKSKVATQSVTFADWRHADHKEKYYFSEQFTREYFGAIDYEKSGPMVRFLDSSVSSIIAGLKDKNVSDSDIDDILKGTSAFTACKAGARLMGWKKLSL